MLQVQKVQRALAHQHGMLLHSHGASMPYHGHGHGRGHGRGQRPSSCVALRRPSPCLTHHHHTSRWLCPVWLNPLSLVLDRRGWARTDCCIPQSTLNLGAPKSHHNTPRHSTHTLAPSADSAPHGLSLLPSILFVFPPSPTWVVLTCGGGHSKEHASFFSTAWPPSSTARPPTPASSTCNV